MDYRIIDNVFTKRLENLAAENDIKTAYALYKHELMKDNEREDFDEAYYRQLVEFTSPIIEKLYEKQNEDGSYEDDIYMSSVFIAIMCIASRVYDELDSIFARDCIHAGLDAAHYLLVNDFDIKSLVIKEKAAMLWAFCELSKTDVEIKNAYDHSMMAGMPQKMSRQKKYKMFVNQLVRELLADGKLSFDEDEYNFDLVLLSSMIILLDTEDIFSNEVVNFTKNWLFELADNIINKDLTFEKEMHDEVLMIAAFACENILNKDNENGSETNLIKVIEYNVIGQKKKLDETEKININDRLKKYLKVLETI